MYEPDSFMPQVMPTDNPEAAAKGSNKTLVVWLGLVCFFVACAQYFTKPATRNECGSLWTQWPVIMLVTTFAMLVVWLVRRARAGRVYAQKSEAAQLAAIDQNFPKARALYLDLDRELPAESQLRAMARYSAAAVACDSATSTSRGTSCSPSTAAPVRYFGPPCERT